MKSFIDNWLSKLKPTQVPTLQGGEFTPAKSSALSEQQMIGRAGRTVTDVELQEGIELLGGALIEEENRKKDPTVVKTSKAKRILANLRGDKSLETQYKLHERVKASIGYNETRQIKDVLYGEERKYIDKTHMLINQLIELQNSLVETHYDYLSEQAINTAERLHAQREIDLTYDRFLEANRFDKDSAKDLLQYYQNQIRRDVDTSLKLDGMKGNIIEQLMFMHGILIRSVFRDIVKRAEGGGLEPNWDVADRYTGAGFTISYEKQSGKLTLQFNETKHRLVYKLKVDKASS